MKKITLFAAVLACTVGMNAQQPTSVTEAIDAGVEILATAGQEGSYVIDRGNRLPVTFTFADRASFDAAVDISSETEDVAGGPGGIIGCDEVIDSAGGSCFAAGEIIEGLTVTVGTPGNVTVYADQGTGFPNANPIIGSNTFTDWTVVQLDGTDNAIGFDLIALTTGATVQVRVFDADGMIDMFDLDATSGGDVFLGMVNETPITSVELEDLSMATAELLGTITIGEATVLGVNDSLLAEVSIFPNPASDILNIKVPASVEITGAVIYDVLGKATAATVVNGQLNVSALSRGVYILNLETTAGVLSEKVIIE